MKLAIDAGHGLSTPGKRCLKSLDPGETREWWLNQRVANYLQEELAQYDGIEILRTDDITGKTDVPISPSAGETRQQKANKWKADFFLSIHHNAGVNGQAGGGIVALVQPGVGQITLDWQKALYNALIASTSLRGNRANPISQQDLAVCRETNMPAVLVECGFMDSSVDVPIILSDSHARKLAAGFASVIVDRWGLKKVIAPAPAPTPTPVPTAPVFPELKAGDFVVLSPGATYFSGKAIPDWVFGLQWVVLSAKGDRVVIDKSRNGSHSICSPVNVKYLRRVGDVDGDGKIDSTDARLVLQYDVKLVELTPDQQLRADVDGNGKVDSTDARLILQMSVGLI